MSHLYQRIITALGVVAAINLVALTALLAWLFATDRMDGARFAEIRRIVATPIPAERAERERLAAESHGAVEAEVERIRLARLPLSAAERADEIDRAIDQAQIRQRLLEEEARLLGRSLDERLASLREASRIEAQRSEERRTALAAEEAILEGERFRRTVALLDAAPPRQAKAWMVELMRTGRQEEAVRYLGAMSRFAVSRLMREFRSAEETALGADLLEALRRRNPDHVVDAP